MTILYINNEYCTSFEQLRGYFNLTLYPQDEVYLDLIDNGRDHIISEWLQEIGKTDFAVQLENIDPNLSDSAYFANMSTIILQRQDINVPLKTEFSQCFSFDSVEQKDEAQGKEITIKLKVLLSVNETYELRLQTSWGTKAINMNPFDVAEEDYITVVFYFEKNPDKVYKVVDVFIDGEKSEIKSILKGLENDFVDLGLSVKWAKCNLGSNSPEEYGDYCSWGEALRKDDYTHDTSTTCDDTLPCITESSQNYVTAAFNAEVRLPTKKEMRELYKKCTWKWTTIRNINGFLVTSKITKRSIFLPAAGSYNDDLLNNIGVYGCYWSAIRCENGRSVYSLCFSCNNIDYESMRHQNRRFSVRLVKTYCKEH